jgi:hypothetical protein
LCPDLLHQVIKGTFKDHLVTWVNEYLIQEHGEARGLEIIQDIDRRYVFIPLPCVNVILTFFLVYLLFPHFLDYDAFQMAAILRSGLEMTQKH